MKSSVLRRITGIFRLLSSSVRLRIIVLLSKRRMTVKEIAKRLRRRSQNISQHLRYLKIRGIVGYRKKENKHFYYLRKRKLLNVITTVKNIFTRKTK